MKRAQILQAILCFAIINCISFAEVTTAGAGDITTVFLELKSNNVTAIAGSTLRARVTLLDAAGNRATTIEGAPISEAVVSIESINFPAYVLFAAANATDATSSISSFAVGPYALTLTNSSAQFAIKYPAGTDITLGSDAVKATVRHGSATVAHRQATVIINAPTANAYVVRTGGISILPQELQEIPPPQANKSAIFVAGDSVTLDVFSAYYTGSKFYFTKKLPSTSAGSVAISISSSPMGLFSGNGVVLTDGHGTVQVQIKDLMIPSILNFARLLGGTPASIASTLLGAMNTGITVKFKAYAPVTRSIGTSQFDVTSSDGQLRIGYDQDLGYSGLLSEVGQSDTAKFRPDAFNKLSVVGLPINAITSTAVPAIYNFFQDNTPASIAPPDAFNFVASPTTAKPAGNQFTVPGYTGGKVYGAILGWDQYNNPAPFSGIGATVPFMFMDTVTTLSIPNILYAIQSGSTFTTVAYSPFVPFAFTSPGVTGVAGKVYFDDTVSGIPAAVKNALQNIKTQAQAVTFNVKNWKQLGYGQGILGTPAATYSPAAVDGFQVANSALNIKTVGFGGDTLNLRPVANDGTRVKVNVERSTEGLATLTIPTDSRDTDKAEQNATFFTKLSKSASNTLHMIIETGDKNASFVMSTPFALATAGIIPADPRDFAPSAVSSSVSEATVALDGSVRGHDTVSIVNNNATPQIGFQNTYTVTILDAFGNAYTGGIDGERLEDSGAVVVVFKADGATPYPGASGDLWLDAINVTFDPTTITAADSKAIVRITAGAATKDILLNLRALQTTALNNVYAPILGIDTPVTVNFASQAGAPFTPITMTAATTGAPAGNGWSGAFPITLESEDGLINSVTMLSPFITGLAPVYTFNAKPNVGKTLMIIAADGRDAEAGSVTLTLAFNPVDVIPPVIGAVTAGNCSIEIGFTDNEALDLAGSTIIVRNSSGDDITNNLSSTIYGDGTIAGTILFTDVPAGSYSLEIIAFDIIGNETTQTRVATVTGCIPACQSVSPSTGLAGQTLDVTVTGDSTHFNSSSIVTFGCNGITVNSTTARAATEIAVNITVAGGAGACVGDVTVATGAENVRCESAFGIETNATTTTTTTAPTSTTTIAPGGGCPVHAEFSANPTSSNCPPLNVQFIDKSQGGITEYLWSFGDGVISTEQNPVHTYNSAGNYIVELIVTGNGCTDTAVKANYISVTKNDCSPAASICSILLSQEGRANKNENISTLREFRDRVLGTSAAGKVISALYYDNTAEVAGILAGDDELKEKFGDLVEEYTPLINRLLSRKQVSITRSDITKAAALLQTIAGKGSPQLQKTITSLIQKMKDKEFLKMFGVILTEKEMM